MKINEQRRDGQQVVEWVGSVLGLLGATLLATHSKASGYGFVAFLASNVCWIYFGYKTRSHGLLTMQAGFTVTSLVGVWQWLV